MAVTCTQSWLLEEVEIGSTAGVEMWPVRHDRHGVLSEYKQAIPTHKMAGHDRNRSHCSSTRWSNSGLNPPCQHCTDFRTTTMGQISLRRSRKSCFIVRILVPMIAVRCTASVRQIECSKNEGCHTKEAHKTKRQKWRNTSTAHLDMIVAFNRILWCLVVGIVGVSRCQALILGR